MSVSWRRAPRFCVRGQQSSQYPWSQSVHWYLIRIASFLQPSQVDLESWASLNVLCGFGAVGFASMLSTDILDGFNGSWREPSTSQYLKSWSITWMAFRRLWRDPRFFWTLSDNALLDCLEFRSSQAMPIAWTVAATIAKVAATNGPH